MTTPPEPTATPPAAPPFAWRRHAAVALGLAAFTALVFAQVRHFDFIVLDDANYVYQNARTLAGFNWDNVRWAFTTLKLANWHPLTWLSHMLDVELFGVRPGMHHLHNVALHALNVVLVYLILVRLTGAAVKSAIVAAIFAIHPLRMESVAWISERKDVLCATFFFLAIAAYARYVETKSRGWYAAVITAFVLGLMAKPMIVTLPAVLVLLDYWPLKRPARLGRLMVEKLPMVAITVLSSALTYFAQSAGGAMKPEQYPISLRLGNSVWAYGRYLRKTFWPNDLAIFYPYYGYLRATKLPWDRVALSGAFLVAITLLGIWLWRRRGERAVLIGWFWFLGTLVPTIGLVQVGTQSMADRYSYIPHIGLLVAIVWGVGLLAERWNALRPVLTAVAGVWVIAFAIATSRQLPYWTNSLTLFGHALEVTDHNAVAHGCLGIALTEAKQLDAARQHYAAALKIAPMNAEVHNNYANLLSMVGQKERALEHLTFAVRTQPEYAEAHNNRANVLADLGRTDEALAEHAEAIKQDPDLAPSHYNFGVTLFKLGRLREAQARLERALQLKPDYADARYTYGLVMAGLGYEAAATAQLRDANFLRSDWLDALRALAWLLATSPDERVRDGRQAVAVAERAAHLSDYENPIALDTLAAAYAEAGRFDNAITTAARAEQLARARMQNELADRFAQRLELYRQGKPFHRLPNSTTQPFNP
jgi:tetratricopeptide (TPR) repeat protein